MGTRGPNPLPAIRSYHRCTIAKLVPQEHNSDKRGTIPSEWCLILMKRLPAGRFRLNWFLVRRPGKRLQGPLRMAQSVRRVCSAKTLAHTGERGGKRV